MSRPSRGFPGERLRIEERLVSSLKGYAGNARVHSTKQIHQIAASIQEFGFNNPILVDAKSEVIAGHGRLEAAKLLGLKSVPTIEIGYLSDAQKRAFVIADNKIALNAGWNLEILAGRTSEPLRFGFVVPS
jgi:ParB-like chromosome segregation protein Spo0J